MDDARSSILEKLKSLLPLLMMCMVIFGLVMFAVTNIVPPWKTYQEVETELVAGKDIIGTREAELASGDGAAILQHRIDKAQQELTANISVFMTQEQSDTILQSLYSYATKAGAEITNLYTQASGSTAQNNGASGSTRNVSTTTEADIYSIRAVRLQISGQFRNLMDFVINFREALVPGVVISNLNITTDDNGSSLLMDIFIYVSSLATGESYLNLGEVPTPEPITIALETTPTPTLNPTLEPLPDIAVTATPEPQIIEGVSVVSKDAVPAEPPLSLIYNENFESGQLDHWKLGANWILSGNTGAQTLQVTDSNSEVAFSYDSLMNMAVQMRVLMSSSAVQLNLRQSGVGWYRVMLQPTGQLALYRGTSLIKATTTDSSAIARWRVLRLSVINGIIRVSVDGNELLTVLDEAELPPGTFTFGMVGRGVAQVDDIQVWSLDQTTPIQ